MTGTQRCDRCWELETRIKADPQLATRILAGIEKLTTAQQIETWRKVLLGELDPSRGRQTKLFIERITTLCDLALRGCLLKP